jgi:hypothetical protein
MDLNFILIILFENILYFDRKFLSFPSYFPTLLKIINLKKFNLLI